MPVALRRTSSSSSRGSTRPERTTPQRRKMPMNRQTEEDIAIEAFMQELVQPQQQQPVAAEEESTSFPDDDGDGDYDPFMIVAE